MTTTFKTPLRVLAMFAAGLGASAHLAQAAPAPPQVVAGQASFAQEGNVFSITNTPNTIIDWQSFSVAAGEITRFNQQSADSAVLNRIVGQDPSLILGALQSNGQVFLINPNGIVFGKDARVDVAGLTASSLDIANSDFLAGARRFQAGAVAGSVLNQGSIATPSGGKVYLIAPQAENSGVITTPGGQAMLAAGRSVELVDSSAPDLHVVLSAPQDAALNLGQIVAQGGRIGIFGALVRQGGTLNADSAQLGANGKIVLKASGDTLIEAGSVTSATSGIGGAGTGGAIHVLGQRVAILGDARLDASGQSGGGSVLVGGGHADVNGSAPPAYQTVFGPDASIRADTLDTGAGTGSGGRVVLWSDHATRALGLISAQGGTVETAGGFLDVAGARVTAASWVLGASNIDIIDTDPLSAGVAGSWSEAGAFELPVDTSTARLTAGLFSSLGGASNLSLRARDDFNNSTALSRATGATGSISVNAGRSITVSAPIDSGGGALILHANHGAYGSPVSPGVEYRRGSVTVRDSIDTGSGRLSVSGYDITLENAATLTGSGGIDLHAANAVAMLAGSRIGSSSHIGITADRIDLLGAIGASEVGAPRPSVSLQPYSPTRAIAIGNGANLDDTTAGALADTRLHLAPASLAAIDAGALYIGNMTGAAISVDAPLALGVAQLTLQSTAAITVKRPISLPSGSGSMLLLNAAAVAVTAEGAASADHVNVRADAMGFDGRLDNGGLAGGSVTLMPAGPSTAIEVGGLALDASGQLGLSQADLNQVSTRRLSIGVSPGIKGHTGKLTVLAFDYDSMGDTASWLHLSAGEGELHFADSLQTGRALMLQGRSIGSAAGARIHAPHLELRATGGIGSMATPLATATTYLSANNDDPGGATAINIRNVGTMGLGGLFQSGVGASGVIEVLNEGGMTLLPGARVSASGSGAVALRTMSPLTIAGAISTGSGALLLEAGNGGVLTVTSTGTVNAGADIALIGGAIVNHGTLATSAGVISSAGPLSGSGSMHWPGMVQTPPPALDVCSAAPGTPGCAGVLPALAQCVATPAMAGCVAVLPSVAQCIANPSAPACAVVLPSVAQCSATPTLAGCKVSLPSLAQCDANPGQPGCAAVLPTLSACVATPTLAGCAAVLPTLAQCLDSPSLQGCSVVLPPPPLTETPPQAAPETPAQTPGGAPLREAVGAVGKLVNQAGDKLADGRGPGSIPAPARQASADSGADKPTAKEDGGSTPAADSNNQGGKRDKHVKTYCN